MRLLQTIAALLLAPLSVLAERDAVAALSPTDVATLQSELLTWRESNAGKNAIQHGFLPSDAALALTELGVAGTRRLSNATATEPSQLTSGERDLLQRFLNAKNTIAALQQTQPKANFSVNSPFALMTEAEFKAFVGQNGEYKPSRNLVELSDQAAPSLVDQVVPNRNLRAMANPTSVDWVAAGKVNTPRDQGSCSVCWAFSSVSTIESNYAILTGGALPSLSEQDIISCGPKQGVCADSLGWPSFDWIVNYNGGSLCSAASFPYGAFNGATVPCARYYDSTQTCSKPDIGMTAYWEASYNNVTVMETLASWVTFTVTLNAASSIFQYYSGGLILGDATACPAGASHMATVVGYGVDGTTKYWKVKNSWSQWWGEGGYFRIEKAYTGQLYGACGIEHLGVIPKFRAQQAATENLRCAPKRQGYKLTGTAVAFTYVESRDTCCDICRYYSGCVGVSMDETQTRCYIYTAVTGATPTAGWSSIVVVDKAITDAQCTAVENNYDYGGNDLMSLLATSAGACCDACNRNPSCTAYTWTQFNSGSCYLKSQRGSTITYHNPNADGTPYYVSGESYKCQPLQSNTDFTGGTGLGSASAATASRCCGICRATAGCSAFAWNSYNGGTCWLKSGTLTAVANTGVYSATVF